MAKGDLQTTLEGDLGVNKKGHQQKLVQAVKKLQYPSKSKFGLFNLTVYRNLACM